MNKQAYAEACAAMNEAQRVYDAVVTRYRAREIGDDEYLTARRALKTAQADYDVAFALAAGWTVRGVAELAS